MDLGASQQVFHIPVMRPLQWVFIALVSLFPITVVEVVKLIRAWSGRNAQSSNAQ